MTDRLVYESIASVNGAIRVVDVLPSGSFDAPLEIELRIVLLDDTDTEYDSLSWCWGPPDDETEIMVNEQSLVCRRSLATALRYLRKSDEILTLWIDAICINQLDPDEKSQQIQMMDSIYRRATRVRIWLGEADDQLSEGFAIFKKLRTGHKLSDFNDGKPVTKRQIDAYNSLYLCPWFERVWITQEFVLSKERVMHLGSMSHALSDIATLEKESDEFVQDIAAHKFDSLYHLLEDGDVSWMEPSAKHFSSLVGQARVLQETFNGSTTGKIVVETIIAASSRQATDLRDKIYGCLGIVPTLAPYLDVDYRYSTEQVYILATYALIAHYQGFLYALTFLAPLEETESTTSADLVLPSWVCDFSQDLKRLDTLLFNIFAATVRQGVPRNVVVESSCLVATGAFFDEVISCCPTSAALQNEFITQRSYFDISKQDFMHITWRAFFEMSETSDERAYIGGGSLEDAYWRTIICDIVVHKSYYNSIQRADAEDIEHMSGWIFDKDSESLPPHGSADQYYPLAEYYVQAAGRWLGDKKPLGTHLFTTRRGYIGHATGRRSVQPGDHVYFLDGGEVPWVLRPVPVEGDAVKAFEVRSECYVHGIMDGEGLKPPVTKESDIDKWTAHELRKGFHGGQSFDAELPVSDYTDVWLV